MDPALLWFFIGVAFLILEFIVPGVILIFFAFAAWVVSILNAFGILDENLSGQLIVFTLVGLSSLFVLRKYIKIWFNGKETDMVSSDLNEQDWLDKKVQVTQKIPANGYGRVEYNGTSWKATATVNIAEKSLVTITSKEGLCFIVKP